MKIQSRPGDSGKTDLGDGMRVSKNHAQIEFYGTLDELNSAIGIVVAQNIPDDIQKILIRIQQELLQFKKLDESHIQELDKIIKDLNQPLPKLSHFILPNGTIASANCHLARAICRRAERRLIGITKNDTLGTPYLNRLSHLLFLIARSL